MKPQRTRQHLTALAVLVSLGVFVWLSMSMAKISIDPVNLWDYRLRFVQGFILTLEISFAALFFSLGIGSLVAWAKNSKILYFNYLSSVYVELIRGTPLLVQIIFFYYIIGTAWGLHNRFWAGVLILSIFEGAYISEIIRGGLVSIESKQTEIAQALGLSSRQTFRFVILPQLVVRVLPALAGQFASVIKDSSLLSTIAVIELMQVTKEITANNFAIYFQSYLLLGGLYLAMTYPISYLAKVLERRFHYEN